MASKGAEDGVWIMKHKCMFCIFKPHPKYGSVFKIMGATLLGYILGKASYQGKCREKILALENSELAEQIRRRRRGALSRNDTYDPHEYAGSEVSKHQSGLKVDAEYDANRVDDRHHEGLRPSVDSDAPLPSPDSKVDRRLSYDELRRLNRSEHDTKQQVPPSQPPAPRQQPVAPSQQEPAKPRVKRNQYGDEIEA